MQQDGFDDVVRGVVTSFVVDPGWSKFVLFKNKLKHIKKSIREWNKDVQKRTNEKKVEFETQLGVIDGQIDQGEAAAAVMAERQTIMRELAKMDKDRSLDAAQNAKVVWSVEGDENSAFFHGMVKKKKKANDGAWLSVWW